MAEKYFPFDSVAGDRVYLAKDFREYFGDIISSGVSTNGDNLPVTSAGGLNISVGPGLAWVKGGFYQNPETLSFKISPGASLPRIDRVVTRLDVAERKINTMVISGAPAASPSPPALLRNADYYEIGLATVYVAASAISITNAQITDTRTDSSVCGVIRCLVERLEVGDFMKNCQAAFEEWFANLEEQFSGDVAGNLQNEINAIRRDLDVGTYTNPIKQQADAIRKDLDEGVYTSTIQREVTSIRSDLDNGVYSTTAIINVYTIPSAAVTLTLGAKTLTANANASGLAVLYPNVLGTWSIKVVSPSNTYTGTVFVENIGIFSAPFPTLNNMSWADINRVGQAGAAPNVFKRGDTKNITVNGETITLRLEDFNHDDLASGGKAKMTFGMKDLFAANQQMNTSNTNAGSWNSSALRSIMATYLSQMPADLRAVIKPVTKKTTAGNQSTTIQSTTDSLWLFSAKEVGIETTAAGYTGEGTLYPLFVDNNSRIKRLSNGTGSAQYWWLRSPNTGNTANFRLVNSDGSGNNTNASTSFGVCLGLCV